jgi:hypothetical protein
MFIGGCQTMIHYPFLPEVALGIAAVGLLFKGRNMQLLTTKTIVSLLQAINKIEIDEAWAAAVCLHLFCRVDCPTLPNIRLDLNQLGQENFLKIFCFDK